MDIRNPIPLGMARFDRSMGYRTAPFEKIPMIPFGQGSLWNIWPGRKLSVVDGEGIFRDDSRVEYVTPQRRYR